MKIGKIALSLSGIALLIIIFLITKNYCLDKGILALKEEKYGSAIKYLKPMAILGEEDAQNLIGECYALGFGVPKDVEKAIYWFRRGTKKSNCSGDECIAADLYFVGEKYLNGVGVKKDRKEAIFWIKKAAENRYPKAIDFLAENKIN
ncbi:MAG: sel1 repeat family protein [Proteobacteria bacterium]|nr:sel1 repeat family protein [Pseudomonadota bacterium]MBU0967799.1 sel1 repeat family protein [Pseudomonadota bacterium]